VIVNAAVVEPNDVLLIPVNGLVLLNTFGELNSTGDKLQAQASANDSIDVTLSWVAGQAEENNA
jgi:hypothetical protein